MSTKSSGFSILVLYFILQFSIWSIGVFFGLSASIHQYLIQAALMLCFLFVLLASKQSTLDGFIRAYIFFAAIMSAAGFLAWYAIYAGYVGTDEFLITMHDLSGGKINAANQHTYSWPYYLGLVLTHVDPSVSSIGNHLFFRASGWASEPHIAATFVMPALIVLVLDKYMFRKNLRLVLIISIISFWIVCAAVSSIISIFLLIVLGQVLALNKKFNPLQKVFIFTVVVLIILILLNFQTEIIQSSSFIAVRFGDNSPTLQTTLGNFLWFLKTQTTLDFLYNSLKLLFAIFVFKVSLEGIFKSGYAAIYGYVMLYLLFIGAKGAWNYTSVDPFTMFFFYLLIFHSYNKGSVIEQNTI